MKCEMCETESMMISYSIVGRATWEIGSKPLDLNKPDFLTGKMRTNGMAICSECGHEQPVNLSAKISDSVIDVYVEQGG